MTLFDPCSSASSSVPPTVGSVVLGLVCVLDSVPTIV